MDESRQRELWKSVGIAGVPRDGAAVLGVAALRAAAARLRGRADAARARTEEEAATRQLRLEIETLRSPKRIETLATERLQLVAPSSEEAIVIERVAPADPPAHRSSHAGDSPSSPHARPTARLATEAHARARAVDWRETVRRRVAVASAALASGPASSRRGSLYLQVVAHADLMTRAERQQLRPTVLPAKRGEIVDRHGRVLATSADADSIFAVPSKLTDPVRSASRLCAALPDCTKREQQAILDRLRRQRHFAWVRRQVPPETAERVAALNLEGIGFLKESRRFYPKDELAAHLLGYVGIDNNGLAGLEAAYDAQVRGKDGTVLVQADALRQAFSRFERRRPPGASSS